MEKSTRLMTQRGELRMKEVEVAFGGVPVSASLEIKNASDQTVLTATSIRGAEIGNATTFTIVNTSGAPSVSISGFDITINAQTGTTTGNDIKTLLDANPDIAALATFTATANTASPLDKTAMSGGDDKLTVSSTSEFASVTFKRDKKGVYELKMKDYDFQDYGGCLADVSGVTALSGVAKVEVSKVTSDTFTVRFADFAGAAGDVAAASKMSLKLFDAKLP